MKEQRKLLIIFQKNLVPGKVKTRLAESIGNDNALKIYELLIKKTWEAVRFLNIPTRVFYNDFIEKNDIWSENNFGKRKQSGKDLGERMYNAFSGGFADGFEKICIIGTDCYDINREILNVSFHRLEKTDFVIGPAIDGGYYLLGMKRLNKKVFRNKNWSTSTVLKETINDISAQGFSYSLLEPLNDIDTAKDLAMIKSFHKT